MGKELDKSLLFIFMLIGAVVVSMTSNQEVKAHELEVLEMHDVPCTTIVADERIEPDFPQEILEAEKKRQPNYMGSINE